MLAQNEDYRFEDKIIHFALENNFFFFLRFSSFNCLKLHEDERNLPCHCALGDITEQQQENEI